MKITTIRNKVNALTKLNLDELDFEGVTEDGQHTHVSADIKQIRKDLTKFSRNLNDHEKQFIDHKFDHQLKNTFGKLVDYYQGDVNRALQAMDFAVEDIAKEPVKKADASDISNTDKSNEKSSDSESKTLSNDTNKTGSVTKK